MGEQGSNDTAGAASEGLRRARSVRARLGLALLVSLLAHAVLIASLRLPQGARPARPQFVVSLAGTTVPPAVAETRPAAPAAPRPAAAPKEDATPPGPAAASVPAAAPASAQRPRRPRPITFRPAEELTDAPAPRGNPTLGRDAPELVWRRLGVIVLVRPDGTVESAHVQRNEITDEIARQLEQAIARLRFEPGRLEGAAVGARIETRLCFDGSGQIEETQRANCWRSVPTTPPSAPASTESAEPR